MAAVEFDAHVADGTIPIPPAHHDAIQGSVHVIVIPHAVSGPSTKIDELLANPLKIDGFRPLSRDEAHERQ